MECNGNGICQHNQKINIKLICHGAYKNLPHKLYLDNAKYEDKCKETQHNATVAHNNEDNWFKVDNGTMVCPLDHTVTLSQITYDCEILESFFENYHVTPTWIDCNYTWGWFDNVTGHWTGGVGKVI